MVCDTPINHKLEKPIIKVHADGCVTEEQYMFIPCGKCGPCRKTRIGQWVFRMEHELKTSLNAGFITLTYGEPYLPISEEGYPTLSKGQKGDLTKFFKLLRHYEKKDIGIADLKRKGVKHKPIKYYAVGEYGWEDGRPHYHIILFNYRNYEILNKAWGKGIVHEGEVNAATIAYTCGYINTDNKKPYKDSDQVPQFAVMSKGLGAGYMTKAIKEMALESGVNYVINERGHKIPMPRYYKTSITQKTQFSDIERKKVTYESLKYHKKIEAKERKQQGEQYDTNKAAGKLTRAIQQRIKKTRK